MKIMICTWTICSERFSSYIIDRIKNDKHRFNLNTVEIVESPCLWNCKRWPNIQIDKEKFSSMNPLKTSNLMFKKLKNNKNVNKKHKK